MYPQLITYANFGYIDFAQILVKNIKTLKYHKLHFYCLDQQIYEELTKTPDENITFELFDVNVSMQFESYNTQNYKSLTHQKVVVLEKALAKYGFIHFIDCDVVVLKEPSVEYWDKYNYDIVFQYDCGFHSKDSPHLPLFYRWTCTGNMTLRNTPATQLLLSKIKSFQQKYPEKNDQDCLDEFFKQTSGDDIRNCTLANLYVYPYEEFTNGYWLSRQIGDLTRTLFFHANHVEGKDVKLNLLNQALN